jgi:hypothetical protein
MPRQTLNYPRPADPTGKTESLKTLLPKLDHMLGELYSSSTQSRGGMRMAMLGHSQIDMNSRNIKPPAANPSRAFFTDGLVTWARVLTRQRFDMDPDGDFGVSGDTLRMMQARLGDVIAYKPTHCLFMGGANDFSTSTFAVARDEFLTSIQYLISNNVAPIVVPEAPRGGSVLTVPQVQFQHRYTNFQREWVRSNRGAYFLDYLPRVTDQTSAVSAPLAGMIKADFLHLATPGAYHSGSALAELINQIAPPQPTDYLLAADYYHPTDNPTGNLLYSGTTNRGLLAGTGGTQTANGGLTYAGGGLAAGATFVRGSATSTCTVTLDKQNPRTDAGRASGERQLVEIAANSGGGADEVYNLRFTPTFADIAAGDWYYGEASVEIITAPVNMWALEFYLLETRPSNSQTAIDMGLNSTLAGVMPSVVWSGVLRTPPIQRTADATAIQANIRARMKTDAGAASVKFAVGDMQVRKVI